MNCGFEKKIRHFRGLESCIYNFNSVLQIAFIRRWNNFQANETHVVVSISRRVEMVEIEIKKKNQSCHLFEYHNYLK